MTRKEVIEEFENTVGLIKQDGKDWLDERDIPLLEYAIEAFKAEPKMGHWIFVDKAHEHVHCSECDYGNVDLLDGRPHNYCPNCGAKMEVGE